MQAYRFETYISKEGIIKLPLNQQFIDREVEIIILTKQEINPQKSTATDFVNKWAGFLSNDATEESKFQYLSDKHK